jgi:F-type H+-transporting ATPase subunit alpha
MPVEKQVAIIYLGTKGLLNKVPVNKIKAFEKEFLDFMDAKHRDVLDTIQKGQLTDVVTSTIEKVGADLASKY